MSTCKQNKTVQHRQQMWRDNSLQQTQWLVRSLLVTGKPNLSTSGFVLPTVAMVSLVIVLLTTAILVRSFDRSRYASNLRVDETVLNAATPALDRARAKIDALLADTALQGETPTDAALYKTINSNRYSLGDETQLKLVYDDNKDGNIDAANNETLTTAWKFPIDTNNNGKFDSYTLYGVYLRSPKQGETRARNPLEARTTPVDNDLLGNKCDRTAITKLVGNTGWYKSGDQLTKNFFVYTAIVPISEPPNGNSNYEAYVGNRGFSALEFQQQQSRIPLSNNTAFFQNDLEITANPNDSTFRLNGRISTNSNLLVGSNNTDAVKLYQISSKYSCFYTQENSKITVGGNVGIGRSVDATDRSAVAVDLFDGFGNEPILARLDREHKSTTSAGGSEVGYNDAAYNHRIALMKQTALSYHPNYNNRIIIDQPPTEDSVANIAQYPQEVKEGFANKIKALVETGLDINSLNTWDILAEQIEIYLKSITRRVPFAEVVSLDSSQALLPYTANQDGTNTSVFIGGTIEPPDVWREPIEVNTNLAFNPANLPQTQPEKQLKAGKEVNLGDRIYVGNNLPAIWKNQGNYVTGNREKQLLGAGINWTDPSSEPRYRSSQVTPLPDARIANRNGLWEEAAAQQIGGGLRIITGAGIYVTSDRSASFLPKPPALQNPNIVPKFTTDSIITNNDNILVWSDALPMTGGAGKTGKGDLLMRATGVYHYKDAAYTGSDYLQRTPTACISSYYDPTNATTARNQTDLPDVSGGIDTNGDGEIDRLADGSTNITSNPSGKSNNGVVYPAYDGSRFTAVSNYRNELNLQARLIFPNGRIVNQPLRNALAKIDAGKTLDLADNSAIDTALCGITILEDQNNFSSNPIIPHGAIKEASFLDAREVKAIAKNDSNNPTNYNLELEQRQPLEVRVTDIDFRLLAKTKLVTNDAKQEYLLPNSGIVYASREDTLVDASDLSTEQELLSPTDFRLDPTRRPHGIRLINGSDLARDDNYREEEKGLIFTSNLPTYILGDFNLHKEPEGNTFLEEFLETLLPSWSNFYARNLENLNNNFACRRGEPGCGDTGDQWRTATLITDAIAVLSNSFQDGFRNQGDYDLRNNIGSFDTTQVLSKNGYFNNNFVTSANWGNNGFPASKNSYLTNGVTPIQRRVNFPEYVMEMCRKLPVSECKPNDWVVGYDTNNNGVLDNVDESNIKAADLPENAQSIQLGAGTTAKFTLQSQDRRYARRVTFDRKSDSGGLVLTDFPNGEVTPIPLGISADGKVAKYAYSNNPANPTPIPNLASNSLWFRTTNNNSGKPFCDGNNNPANSGCISDDRSYASDKPLYYDASDTRLISPRTPEISNVPSLNLPESNPASTYTICTKTSRASKKYTITQKTPLEAGNCSSETGNPQDAISATLEGLLRLNPGSDVNDNIVSPKQNGTFAAGEETTFTDPFQDDPNSQPSGNVVNVIRLDDGNQTLGTNDENPTTIKLVGNENSVFVLQKPSGNLNFADNANCAAPCKRQGVVIELEGVDPNNIFWAMDATPQWNAVDPSSPHQMKGTFISKGTAVPNLKNVNIEGRLLGFNNLPAAGQNFTEDSTIVAVTSNEQPALVPVLQIHSPDGSPSNNLDRGNGEIQDEWLQIAEDTTVNAVFVAGNSPSRTAEISAGLTNFVRFLENWADKTLNIKGSLIQYKHSAYATAPFATILAANADDNNGSLSSFGYSFTQYKTNNGNTGTLPYFNSPNRQWSFDVGLLYQLPDIFAQKFTQQSTNPSDEFFREVSRDDPWIETLLCAAENRDTGYNYAVDQTDRPATCQPITAYNDSQSNGNLP